MIYFIQRITGGPIKIGTSSSVSQRLVHLINQYQTDLNVLAVMDGDHSIESTLHSQFSRLRVEGEWFNPGPELTCFIKEHGKQWNGANDVSTNGPRNKRPATLNLDKEVWERLKAIKAESGATPSVTASRILSRALVKEERVS